jgi:DNA-binding PadR family transcriptional regulator
MMAELEHHGYRIGPGTLYPLLHSLERARLLQSTLKNVEGRSRRIYKITPEGGLWLRREPKSRNSTRNCTKSTCEGSRLSRMRELIPSD